MRPCDRLHEDFVFTLTSTHKDALYLVSRFVQGIDDMLCLMSDGFHGSIVMERQRIEIRVHC
jgi:hypothetical protein